MTTYRTTLAQLQTNASANAPHGNAAPYAAPAKPLLDAIEGDQRFMYTWMAAGPAAPGAVMRAPASAWQAVAAGQFDGMCWSFAAMRGNGNDTVLPMAFVMDGTLGVGGDWVHDVGRGEIVGGPLLGVWSDQVWAGGGVAYVDEALKTGVRLGGLGNAQCHNHCEVRLPGLPLGQSASASKATVQLREHRALQWTWIPAATLYNWVRVLCRIDRSSTRDTTYDALLDHDVAGILSEARTNTFSRWIIGTWRGLWNHHPLPIPALEHPERLQAGETRTTTFGRRRSWLASFGAVLVFFGWQRAKAHQSKVSLTRNANDTVTVEWEQTIVRSHRALGVFPGSFGADWGVHKPVVKSERFTMPLTPETLKAYRTFIEVLKHKRSPEQERQAFTHALGHMQARDARSSVSEGHSRSYEYGTRVPLFPSTLWDRLLPAGFASGLASNTERRVFSVRDESATRDRYMNLALNQRLRLLGPNGRRQNNIVAVVEECIETTSAGERLLMPTVVVGGRFALSRADASEVQRFIATPLNNHFGADITFGSLEGSGWRASRDVDIERRLGLDDLAFLGALDAEDVAAVQAASGVDMAAWRGLCDALRGRFLHIDNSYGRVRLACEDVQHFVDAAGLPAVGALRHALRLRTRSREDEQWTVGTQSSGYDAVEQSMGVLRGQVLHQRQRGKPALGALKRASQTVRADVRAAQALLRSDRFLSQAARDDMQHALDARLFELGQIDAELGAGLDKSGAPDHQALQVQAFLRTHSEPRFVDAAETSKHQAGCDAAQTLRDSLTGRADLLATLEPWALA